MKKLVALLLALAMVFAMGSCGKPEETDNTKTVLKDETHALWVAHGNFLLPDGSANGWGGKDTEVYEKSALTAISLADLKDISEAVYTALSGKDVKYLYKGEVLMGTNDPGWNCDFMKDGKKYRASGSFAIKAAQCTVDVDGDTKVYAEDQWIPDPKTAYAESLTPDTLFFPTWQEAKDENGFAWDMNPVVTGGPGLYIFIVAQYKNASTAGNPGYGVAMILKEKKDGLAYEEVKVFVPADHTYGIVGSFEASKWADGADVAMTKTADNVWSGEVALKAGDELKVRADGKWDDSWGKDGGNITVDADGTYTVTITFSGSEGTVEVKAK